MRTFTVMPPTKTPHAYLFDCKIKAKGLYRCGVRTETFDIPHDPLWDTLYPLMFLTRSGGPHWKYRPEPLCIKFTYPVVQALVDMYLERSAKQGMPLTVDAPGTTMPGDTPSVWQNIVGFGGGKESSLVCGMARELGYSPRMLMGSPKPANPGKVWTWPDISFAIPCNKGVTDRIVIQIMSGNLVFHGAALEDGWRTNPWTQYYAIGTQEGWDQLNDVFTALGVDRKVVVPLQGIPGAQIPRILCNRYPDVADLRMSVNRVNDRSEKNLHVFLCEVISNVPWDAHIKPDQILEQTRKFLAKCPDVDTNDGRMVTRIMMRAMLYEARDHEHLTEVRHLIKDEWKRRHIHLGHYYRKMPEDFEQIYREYLEASPDGTDCPYGIWLE